MKKSLIKRGEYQATGTVVDSCSFADGEDMTVEQGCSSIYVTRAVSPDSMDGLPAFPHKPSMPYFSSIPLAQTFVALGGDPNGSGRIQVDSWDL